MAIGAVVAACGQSQAAPVTPASVSVQLSDLPGALTTCQESGDIVSHLAYLHSVDDASYQTANSEWTKEKDAGATGAWVQVIADSKAQCDQIATGQPSNASSPKVILSYVIAFKSSAAAQSEYGQEVFGLNPADFQQLGGTVVKGSDTGLGANSATVTLTRTDTASGAAQTIFLAVWQNGSYLVAFLSYDLAPGDAKTAVAHMNGRIH